MLAPERFLDELLELYRTRGGASYGEGVSQITHALQCGLLAVRAGADAEAVTAALLHDVGHLLAAEGEDAAERGLDTRHEVLGARWLGRAFGPRVRAAVRWHVEAKRYLCRLELDYSQQLSTASQLSLRLQGGVMGEAEAAAFAARPYAERAVQLRLWDDQAKDPTLATPEMDYFRPQLRAALALAPYRDQA